MSPIRVLVVDDDALVRAGLTVMLGGTPTLRIVGEAADGCEVPDAVRRLRPDVVLMDIRMPQVDGVTATERLRRRADAPKVIILTTFDADRQVLAALRAGAAGFLLKDTRPADIVRAIETVAAGDATLSPTITRQVIAMLGTGEQGAERAAARARVAGLTDRERDVARGVARGLPNAEIAATTYLSVATVKAYVSRLLDKLDLDNRVQLALLVAQADTDD
ncbi:Two component transcriptional regulator, LuxR family [Frankia canadensis]|uniref:Two component transcriptional regulator, LuxR family n=1 Tax=Frankia canadensis TaxID=1836972 RepID=A0A2I2KP44_9ACTN|nr:response regulator transcription factor [Frankia canadensis]SNQ47443.1 Two component transcriptional regulator, LuxR family [Frankia canadensis]SOU54733.1 Two component transcriptional regulator, LuxR family [Frankia canadensis]